MSAYLDKSQGVTFVFSNIFEIYKKAKEAKIDAPYVAERTSASARVIKKEDAKVEEFQPAELKTTERTFPVPMGVKEAEEKAMRANMRPIANLQKNLSELTDAHERLKFLLQEIDALTKKK
jgi:hypothetical protein